MRIHQLFCLAGLMLLIHAPAQAAYDWHQAPAVIQAPARETQVAQAAATPLAENLPPEESALLKGIPASEPAGGQYAPESTILSPEATPAVGTLVPGVGIPPTEQMPLEVVPQAPASQPLGTEEAPLSGPGLLHLISPTGYLEYDEENNLIYSREHARVEYQGIVLEADRMIFDMNLQEVQAEGNVVMTQNSEIIDAQAIRYNFKTRSGVMLNAHGQMGVLRFSTSEKNGRPSFQAINKDVTLMRNLSLTSDDFPIPMYDIQAREAMVLENQRLLLRGAVLRVRQMPILYLPYYSRAITGSIPWYVQFGTSSRSGFFARLGYSYHHTQSIPAMDENGKSKTINSEAQAHIFADYYSMRGEAAGFNYDYNYHNDAHAGHVELYGIPQDANRKVAGEENSPRWQAVMHSRSNVTAHTTLQWNVDTLSDPEVYYDLLDNFNAVDRGRVPERYGNAALTLNREDFIARVRVEIKDRIGRDRFSDFSDPNDNNHDFDVEPGIINKNQQGISRSRWGLVSEKAPEINLATNYLRLAQSNFYYHAQMNIFNSLDRGLNIVASNNFTARDTNNNILFTGNDADAFVEGVDFYQDIMHVHRFSERLTWTNQVGVGMGVAQRVSSNNDLVDGSRGFAPTGVLSTNRNANHDAGYYDGLWFTDPNTFHAGLGSRTFSYNDVDPGFFYADFQSRLEARITDALTANIRYTGRDTTKNYLGDFYASMGDQSFRSDLYDFPLRSNWLEGSLNYALLYPSINMYTSAGLNMISQNELWPNEQRWYYTPLGINYTSAEQTVSAGSALTFLQEEYYDTTDPRSYLSDQVRWGNNLEYRDPGEQWWARVATGWSEDLNKTLNSTDNSSLFTEGDNRFQIEPTLGTRVGPKWTVVGSATYDSSLPGLQGGNFSFNRDLHDALLAFRLRLRQTVFSRQDLNNQNQGLINNLDLSVTIEPKLPQQQAPLGVPQRTTLDQKFKSSQLQLEG